MAHVADVVESAMIENVRVALNQDEYRQKNDAIAARFEAAKEKHDALSEKISDIETREQNLRHYQ